ncbi:hypothetical protein [Streptomyces sp.]|uniref:hypothetical protein n=1 Tax=Streptomyces sp. TaxID=1931 RepID=UPI002F416985
MAASEGAASDEAGPEKAVADQAAPDDTSSDKAGAGTGPDASNEGVSGEDASDEDASDEDASDEDASGDGTPEAADPGDTEDGADEAPLFEVSDRRASITADRTGITLRLDDQEAEFDWDEIGAVEIDTPRFGRRFAITVYTSGRRWYQADVEAPSRSTLKSWTAELDAVLDAHFAENGEPQDA